MMHMKNLRQMGRGRGSMLTSEGRPAWAGAAHRTTEIKSKVTGARTQRTEGGEKRVETAT